MRCPRCQRASRDDAVFCPGCGAPLALRAEPAPRPLDASVSLDRRAGERALALDPSGAEQSASWNLGAPHGASTEAGPSLGAAAPEDDPDDFQFGPLPELAADLEPEPEPGTAGSFGRADVEAAGAAAASSGPLHRALDLDRALGLAADPVHPHDLGLGQDGEADGQLDRDLDLGGPPGSATPPRPFAAAARDLALEHPRPPRAPVVDHRLDLALDLGRAAIAGAALAPASELDLALPSVARPDERHLPLPRAAARRRGARAGRRAASWAIDAAPFVVLWAAALAAVYARVPVSPGAHASTWELVLRDGGAIARPLLVCAAVLALVYQTLAHALAGATLGKWLLGLRLVGPDGARPSIGRSAARAALSAASVLVLGLGLLPALFTPSGRALHDISSGTRVVEAP